VVILYTPEFSFLLSLQILYNTPLSPFLWEFHDKFLPSEVEKRTHIPALVSLKNDATSFNKLHQTLSFLVALN
jgi:hypothetical protein